MDSLHRNILILISARARADVFHEPDPIIFTVLFNK